MSTYDEQVRQQIAQYAAVADLQALPPIYFRWSSKYVQPAFHEVFGVYSMEDFYFTAIAEAGSANLKRIFSMGCGDGVLEVSLAKHLLNKGVDFHIEASDLSPALIDRFKHRAAAEGLESHFTLHILDVNHSALPGTYDVIIANQILHHIVELESVIRAVKLGLSRNGIFATNDMIGRNGHLRWPEVDRFVRAYWPHLRPAQRYNLPLKREEPEFIDNDCSTYGFEGVRAQEVLPLILRELKPKRFFSFGGLIDVFVDRCYGYGFDPERPEDCAFIDHVGAVNEMLLESGFIKPTMMLAHFVKEGPVEEKFYRNRSAEFSVRR